MIKKLFFTLIFTTLLFADFSTMSTKQVQDAIKNGVAIIDIRREDEWKHYGIIKGSHKITFFDEKGGYNGIKWLKEFSKIVKTKDQPFILVCAHANRTKVVGKMLQLRYTKVYDLEGGIKYGWLDKGLKTVK
ncbi:MAG: rhodanese-like domain-containing protein [Campylobacterota bacterium]|nr:rhodanese-like domain-containing protein [Campylobacterota bacterium]